MEMGVHEAVMKQFERISLLGFLEKREKKLEIFHTSKDPTFFY